MLALMLDVGALGAMVITILSFVLWYTPIGSASLLLHLVGSSIIILCSLGRVGVMSAWLPVVTIRSRSSLGYVFAHVGSAAGAGCYGAVPAAAAATWVKVFAFSLPLPVTSTQSSTSTTRIRGTGQSCDSSANTEEKGTRDPSYSSYSKSCST